MPIFRRTAMVKPKNLANILKEDSSLLRKVSLEEIENTKAGFDDSAIEKAYADYLKVKERK